VRKFWQCFLISLPFFATAQNWELFNSYDRYNYKQPSSPLINSVLFADSFRISVSDTIYFLNTIVERNNTNNQRQNDTAQVNRWQFLQRQIERRANGWYNFFDPSMFTINAYANSGDQWVYDTLNNISASAIKVDTMTVFGTLDSVKEIALSNGIDTILISRSFGILEFPADTADHLQTYQGPFSLQGIETRNIGDSIIRFRNVFDFNVGDVFVYQSYYAGDGPFRTDILKCTILSKQITNNLIAYSVRQIDWAQWQGLGGNGDEPNSYLDTIVWAFGDSSNHVVNSYPGQFFDFIYGYNGSFASLSSSNVYVGGSPLNTFSSYFLDTSYNLPCKKIGVNSQYGIYDSIQNDQMICYGENSLAAAYECKLCQGVGFTHYSSSGFEDFYYEADLIAYTYNGITYGAIPTDESLLGHTIGLTEIGPELPVFRVYPTIVNDMVAISCNNNALKSTFYFAVFDLTGRQLMKQPLSSTNTSINLTSLSSAIYMWNITDDNNIAVRSGKIIKQ